MERAGAAAAPNESVAWIAEPPHEYVPAGVRATPPTADPFYEPPTGFEHAEPGTVLRSREVELAFLGLFTQRTRATQLLFRSTDANGRPDAAVTTVLLPPDKDPATVPLVSYQCAIDAVLDRCFPSYAFRRGSHAGGSFTQAEFLLVAALVNEGWAVSVPDHEGIHGCWGAPKEPGYRALDGLRAVLGTSRLGLSPDARIGVWGYSGGGLASAWAAELADTYAPELNVVGAVLGSPVGDLGFTLRRLNGGLFAGLPGLVIAALTHIYPGLQRVIDEYVTPEGAELLERIKTMPTLMAVAKMAFKDLDNLVNAPLEQVLQTPEVQEVFKTTKLGQRPPAAPVLVIQAIQDQIISTACVDELVDTYIQNGADVSYHRDVFNEHIVMHPMSAPLALKWLGARFAGEALPAGPTRTAWPVLLHPATYRGLLKLGWVSAKTLAGKGF